ncbi:MAG: GntR family transcriptional regulator [Candidatus Avoscillospira sp.]
MLLRLDFSIDTPIYQQIRNQIVRGIAAGDLKPGDQLPPIRTLAEDCGVNMMTVSKAYQQLKQEGYLKTDRRAGTVVCPRLPSSCLPEQTRAALELALAEAKAAGTPLEEILALCRKQYDSP